VRLKSAVGRGILATTIIGSGMAFLDSTIANVATRRIGEQFNAGFGALQWVLNGYTLPLASLILLGGALGDRLGRRRIYLIGVVWFAAASALCALAPSIEVLIAARALQGVGGALLTPGSLAIISATFVEDDRPAAVGAWSGLGGVATALGPFLGGWLVQDVSWRWAFAINVPLGALVIVLGLRYVPESRAESGTSRPLDVIGTVLVAAALGGLTYGTTEAGSSGWGLIAWSATLAGAALLVAFVLVEIHSRNPLVPLGLFADRTFTGTNIMTFATYGAMGALFFVLALQLQVAAGYGPFAAGIATLPATVALLLLSSRAGALAARIGPRLLLTTGPLLAAAGLALLLRIDATHRDYLTDVLPGVLCFGVGMATLVAPLTATVMGSAPDDQVGIASGVNNAVARAASLLAVAVLPPLAGLRGNAYRAVPDMVHGFRIVTLCCIGLLIAASGVVVLTVRHGTAALVPTDELASSEGRNT
jgi:EmrB/QacA subfamily drug resistance transporter